MADSKVLTPLDFERPIFEMEAKIRELEELSRTTGMNLNGEVTPLKNKLDELTAEIFSQLTPWQRVQLARHPARPATSQYIEALIDGFIELHGDRSFRDDLALVCGLGTFRGRRVLVVGHRKGRDTKEKLACNFGCAHPEGYKKAGRAMRLAEKFRIPVITFINTPGAYPGIGAEERGQAYAIAENIALMAGLKVPIVCTVIGEGGSGGALGIGVGDRLLMLEHAYYSVISPEGCAAILWKSAERATDAAAALRLTSRDLLELGVADEVIPEPLGGAHRRADIMVAAVADAIERELDALSELSESDLLEARYRKIRAIGSTFAESPPAPPEPAEAEAVGDAAAEVEIAPQGEPAAGD